MDSRFAAVICLFFFLSGGCSDHHPASEFHSSANGLREARDYWLKHGRPADFQPGEFLGISNEAFVCTNIITTTNGAFNCRFAERFVGWPPGMLVITDDGAIIFVSDNGKVTISPDEHGVDP